MHLTLRRLTGAAAMQTISYYRSKNEDSIYLKLTVCAYAIVNEDCI